MKFEHALGHLEFERKQVKEELGGTGKKKMHQKKTAQNVTNTEKYNARVMITTGPLDVEDDN